MAGLFNIIILQATLTNSIKKYPITTEAKEGPVRTIYKFGPQRRPGPNDYQDNTIPIIYVMLSHPPHGGKRNR